MNGWDWRKAAGGIPVKHESWSHRIFHAYDGRNLAACTPCCGLLESVEPPNEGSEFCPSCMEVVRVKPADQGGDSHSAGPVPNGETP